MVAPRDVTPIVAKLRNFLLGVRVDPDLKEQFPLSAKLPREREYKNHLRFEGRMSARTQPPPCLPEGVAHKLAHNFYTDRDARREVTPPDEVYLGNKKLLASGKIRLGADKRPVIPGFPFSWSTGRPGTR